MALRIFDRYKFFGEPFGFRRTEFHFQEINRDLNGGRLHSAIKPAAILWGWRKGQGYYGSWLPFLLDLSANPSALPLGFHRAHLSLRARKTMKPSKIMNETSSDAVAPPLERIVTHWRRFSMGLWRVPEGDIAAAYSASSFPKISVFVHEGRLFTNGGAAYSKWVHTEVSGYPLIPADEYQGAESVPYSYEGREAAYKGKVFRLGAKTLFISSDPTVEDWRRLFRSLFADGGLFASGCDYREFLTSRCEPDSENSRVASVGELADCDNGVLPLAKDAMRDWIDAGSKSLPTQQLAFQL